MAKYWSLDVGVINFSNDIVFKILPVFVLIATTFGGHFRIGVSNVFTMPTSSAHKILLRSATISTTDCNDWQWPSSCILQLGNGVNFAWHVPFSNDVRANVAGTPDLYRGNATYTFVPTIWARVAIIFLLIYFPALLYNDFVCVLGHSNEPPVHSTHGSYDFSSGCVIGILP